LASLYSVGSEGLIMIMGKWMYLISSVSSVSSGLSEAPLLHNTLVALRYTLL